jgi:signal peptidase I
MTQPATSSSAQSAAPAPAGGADAAAAARPADPKKTKPRESNVKETIESILVAFILAFIFRAFVVEAFVIPTGSMAPTLLGAHMRFRCNDCGYRFDANYSALQSKTGDLVIKDRSDLDYQVYCPNCGYKFPSIDPSDPENDASRPPVHYGDRILVLKYLYLLREPQRWDVVVFKSPANDDPDPSKPPSYQQNYIKRLIGKPGESIMILDGDIYAGKPGDDKANYKVQTKPQYAQDALWRVVYDNDYCPAGIERGDGAHFRQPWTIKQGTGWNLGNTADGTGRTFRFDNASGESTLFFDREANPATRAFTDWLAYDVEQAPPSNTVKDLKLAFYYDRQSGDGPLRVNMSDGRQTFSALLTPNEARLVQYNSDGEHEIGRRAIRGGAGRDPIRVELTNADYRVTLRVDDEIVAQTTPEQYHPDMDRLLRDAFSSTPPVQPPPVVEISATNQAAALSHVGLWRDVYYLNRGGYRLDNQPFVGSPRNVANLGDDEYYVLGDNSLISGDARYWTSPIELPADRLHVPAGRVPGRFLLGRAFFVYWPAGFRPISGFPALAPNFGDMRFIR